MNLKKEGNMMKRLQRVRKVERLFHLPIDSLVIYDKTHSKEYLEWKYIKLHFNQNSITYLR
jgi:hypothetical protein